MGDAEHGAGHQTLLGRGPVCGPDQAPVWLIVATLQNFHRLATSHRQLVAVAGHEVVYHHSQLTATRELRERRKDAGFHVLYPVRDTVMHSNFRYETQWAFPLTAENLQVWTTPIMIVCVCLTLSLSSVFCEVREAREMVSGWLLPSPWLSRSSPSLTHTQSIKCVF